MNAVAWLVALACWELAGRVLGQPQLFPGPVHVSRALVWWWNDGTLLTDVAASLTRIAVGFGLGGSLGLALGAVSGRQRWLGDSVGSVINGLRALPPVALVPLAILWFGISEQSKVFLVAWGAFFPVWLNTHIGVGRLDRTIAWSALSLGATGPAFTLRVVLPSALPQIVAGLRLAIGISYICVFVAELSGAHQGVGFRISTAHLVFRADLMLAGLAVLALLGAATDAAFLWLVRRRAPWLELDRQIESDAVALTRRR